MSYLNKLKITFSVVGVVMPCCGCLETSCLLLRSGFPLCVRLWASASVFITEASSPHRWHHVSCLQAKDSDDDEEVVQVDRDHFMDEFFEQVRQRAQVTAGSHVTTGLNHELDTVRVVNSSWEHWDCSVWDKRLLRGRCTETKTQRCPEADVTENTEIKMFWLRWSELRIQAARHQHVEKYQQKQTKK